MFNRHEPSADKGCRQPRALAELAIGGLLLTLLGAADAAQAQDHREMRTEEGCLYYGSNRISYPPGTTYRWRGGCQPGQYINGSGVLEVKTTYRSGSFYVREFSGQMVGGYWHGRGTTTEGDGSASASYSWISNMGCDEGDRSCVPGVVPSFAAPVLERGNGPPTNEIRSGYLPNPNRIESSNPPGFGLPVIFLHPDTGRPCVTLTEVEARDESDDRRHRIVHVLHFENVCRQVFSYSARRIALGEQITDPDGISGTGIAPALSEPTKSSIRCIEEGERDACLGFSEWWVSSGGQRTDPMPVK